LGGGESTGSADIGINDTTAYHLPPESTRGKLSGRGRSGPQRNKIIEGMGKALISLMRRGKKGREQK